MRSKIVLFAGLALSLCAACGCRPGSFETHATYLGSNSWQVSPIRTLGESVCIINSELVLVGSQHIVSTSSGLTMCDFAPNRAVYDEALDRIFVLAKQHDDRGVIDDGGMWVERWNTEGMLLEDMTGLVCIDVPLHSALKTEIVSAYNGVVMMFDGNSFYCIDMGSYTAVKVKTPAIGYGESLPDIGEFEMPKIYNAGWCAALIYAEWGWVYTIDMRASIPTLTYHRMFGEVEYWDGLHSTLVCLVRNSTNGCALLRIHDLSEGQVHELEMPTELCEEYFNAHGGTWYVYSPKAGEVVFIALDVDASKYGICNVYEIDVNAKRVCIESKAVDYGMNRRVEGWIVRQRLMVADVDSVVATFTMTSRGLRCIVVSQGRVVSTQVVKNLRLENYRDSQELEPSVHKLIGKATVGPAGVTISVYGRGPKQGLAEVSTYGFTTTGYTIVSMKHLGVWKCLTIKGNWCVLGELCCGLVVCIGSYGELYVVQIL